MVLPVKPGVSVDIILKLTKSWRLEGEAIDAVSNATHLGIQLDRATGGVRDTIINNIFKA